MIGARFLAKRSALAFVLASDLRHRASRLHVSTIFPRDSALDRRNTMESIEQTHTQKNETIGIVELNEEDLSRVSGGLATFFSMNGYAVLVSASKDPGVGVVVLTGTCGKDGCHYK
jgi:hypothetical protein